MNPNKPTPIEENKINDAEEAISALKDGEFDNPKLAAVGYLYSDEDKNIELIRRHYGLVATPILNPVEIKVGDKVKDLSGITGTVIEGEHYPALIRVAFGKDGKSDWRDLQPKHLTPVNPVEEGKHTQGEVWIDDNGFIAIGKGDDYKTFADLDCSNIDISEREANKDRFVKCWNEYDGLKAENKRQAEDIKELRDAIIELLDSANPSSSPSKHWSDTDLSEVNIGYPFGSITIPNSKSLARLIKLIKKEKQP